MKTICITGLDGSGKTTQAKLLSEKLPNSRFVSVWDIVSRPEFKGSLIYNMPPNIEEYVMNVSATSRSLFVFYAFNEAYERALNSNADYIVFDSFWYKYWAIEKAMGGSKNLEKFIFSEYKEPDFIFYLDLPIESLPKRKPKISHYESGNKDKIDYTNFLKIQKKAKTYLESFLPKKTITINADFSIKEIEQKIIADIKLK